ncbi:hypothetical protein V2J09_016609 [Rumex salicifolius]
MTTNKAPCFRCSLCSNEIRDRDSDHGLLSNRKKCIRYKGGRVSDFPTDNKTPRAVGGGGKGVASKRALVCGVSYKNQKYKLRGTQNDAFDMRTFLVQRWGFSPTNIRMLTEEGNGRGGSTPTKKNIEQGMRWLVEGCKAGDSLVFYFSGHGVNQQENSYGDEIDGLDESLCPVDFSTSGVIRDDDINAALVRPLPHGVTLHAIVDACHSGTILDLPWVYNAKPRKEWVDNSPPSGANNKGTSGGRAISFSACRDDQMAADTSAFSNKGMNGALTMSFIQALNNNQDLSYHKLLVTMQDAISKSRGSRFRIMLDKFLHRYFVQDPLLSSSEIFDINDTKFHL